jgi:hypothetical protein
MMIAKAPTENPRIKREERILRSFATAPIREVKSSDCGSGGE